MAKQERKRGFDNLINTTTQAFDASMEEQSIADASNAPKMVNNRQSVYKVPLSMIRPDRFQARFVLPYELRQDFYSGKAGWAETTRQWLELAKQDRLIAREISELSFLGDSLHDTGQIKPVTGQVMSEQGRDVFYMLTGERRFWATAIKAIQSEIQEEPCVLAIIDNQPTLDKQIAENMAYKELTAVGKARAAARIVLEANGISPQQEEDEYEYFRKISDVRLDDNARQRLQESLQLERTYFGRLMKFFDLPERMLELCDRSEMPERVLREIMQYDHKLWENGVTFFAEREGRSYLDVHVYLEGLSGKIKNRPIRLPVDPTTKSARAIRRALYALEDIPEKDKVGALADAMVGDINEDQAVRLLKAVTDLQTALAIRVRNIK